MVSPFCKYDILIRPVLLKSMVNIALALIFRVLPRTFLNKPFLPIFYGRTMIVIISHNQLDLELISAKFSRHNFTCSFSFCSDSLWGAPREMIYLEFNLS